eukprot:TRINITY_DN124686_c0_g1_i1.p1 TRINITY_DN124686_c0_g1~~TRINITY_DN124686_c0_g1_i1.p1  ORF type:complete len:505 (+),score=83.27 TRINITY_DN124686_c0_g1_i1:68-1582(+)
MTMVLHGCAASPVLAAARRLRVAVFVLQAWLCLAQDDRPRYVMCPQGRPGLLDGVQLGGKTLRIYAASIASNEGPARVTHGRFRTATSLHAALLVDGEWDEPQLATFDGKNAQTGHHKSASYAKCRGRELPPLTGVQCRILKDGHRNVSWSSGRINTFLNQEVVHQTAMCDIGRPTLRWRRQTAPARLEMELKLRIPLTKEGPPSDASPEVVLPLELCLVEQPLYRVSFCSMPLYGFGFLSKEVPWVMEDWLQHHLSYVGFDHAEIYDNDGTFAESMRPWRGKVAYHANWPRKLSPKLEEYAAQHPCCTETYAYTHCLTEHRALSRWVALLHGPDEYMFSRRYVEPGKALDILRGIQTQFSFEKPMGMLRLHAHHFGQTVEDKAQSKGEPGGILAGNTARTPMSYPHVPILDPFVCHCSGPHACYSEAHHVGGEIYDIPEGELVLHHYVEMLDRDYGRCDSMSESIGKCDVRETLAMYPSERLKAIAVASGRREQFVALAAGAV